MKHFAYHLRCKSFVLETDHNNLLWIEASVVPKVVRWRIYLQSFNFLLRHIPGRQNVVADFLSRHTEVPCDALRSDVSSATLVADDREGDPIVALLCRMVHLSNVSDLAAEFDSQKDLVPPDDFPSPVEFSLLPSLGDPPDLRQRPADAVNDIVDVVVPPPPFDAALADENLVVLPPEEIISKVHGGRMGHPGVRETWKALNFHFPGHRISYKFVSDFVSTCPTCQKDRLGMSDALQPIARHLKPPHARALVGVDTLSMSPTDDDGNNIITIVVNMFTKFTALYAGKDHTAETTALALFRYVCTYGLFDALVSDPGSEFDNEVVCHLNEWFGIRHVFSLVDRHQSNGSEGTVKLVSRMVRWHVMDERLKHKWSSPLILSLVQFELNSRLSSETGVVPFHAVFGTADLDHFRIPEGRDGSQVLPDYIKLLDENIKTVRDLSKKFQDNLVLERTLNTPAEKQNMYQPGDLVLFQLNPDNPRPTKLSPRYVGPYEVIHQYRNDVRCKHIVLGHFKEFHVERLKIFHGTLEQAKKIAMLDNDQYVIEKFLSYRGDPAKRSTVEFFIQFADDSKVWLPYSKDLFETVQYEEFCRSRPELILLLYDSKVANGMIASCNKSPIIEVQPGDVVFIDLRSYGATWYASLSLPDLFEKLFLLEYHYTKWVNRKHLKIHSFCPVFNEKFEVDHDFVARYGTRKEFPTDGSAVLIDEAFVAKYPSLLK